MATGNLFLGIARRKVGDVVLYRRNGQQVSRVRVRNIANPKSVGQALQRNYMAPISRFYSPLSAVLEKSWEGLNRSQSQSAFMSANLRIARENGFYVPKNAGFTPLPYQLSHGNIPPVSYSMADNVLSVYLGGVSQPMTTVGQLSQRFVDSGYLAGDQITIIAVLEDDPAVYRPTYSRFILDTGSESTIDSVIPLGCVAVMGNSLNVEGSDVPMVAGAVIVSRYRDSVWRRSRAFLSVDANILNNYLGDEAYQRAIESYRNGSSVNISDVYLNGSTSGGDVTPVPLDSAYARGNDNLMYYITGVQQLNDSNGDPLYLDLIVHSFNAGLRRAASAKVGSNYITSRTTKGQIPERFAPTLSFDCAENPDLVRWLIAQGVDEELFT